MAKGQNNFLYFLTKIKKQPFLLSPKIKKVYLNDFPITQAFIFYFIYGIKRKALKDISCLVSGIVILIVTFVENIFTLRRKKTVKIIYVFT